MVAEKVEKPSASDQSPVIPGRYVDAFQQRQLALSICALLEAIKGIEALSFNVNWAAQHFSDGARAQTYSHGWHLLVKYSTIEASLFFLIILLKVFSQKFSKSNVVLTLSFIVVINFILFGRWSFLSVSVAIPGLASLADLVAGDYVTTTSGRRVRVSQLDRLSGLQSNEPRLGKHTIHILPHATANLNPSGDALCISGNAPVTIPLLVNNTEPALLSFRIVDLYDGTAKFWNITVDELHLEASGRAGVRKSQKLGQYPLKAIRPADDDDDNDDDEEDEPESILRTRRTSESVYQDLIDRLEPAQTLYTLSVARAGVYSLQRMLDVNDMDVEHLHREVVLASCPSATIIPDATAADKEAHGSDRCVGEMYSVTIQVEGTPPMKLTYQKLSGGKTETKHVESIGEPKDATLPYAPQKIEVPLDSPLTLTGEHGIVISTVEDALGNRQEYRQRRADLQTTNSHAQSYRIFAHSQASIAWRTSGDASSDLLKNQTVNLPLLADDFSRGDGPPWEVRIGLTKTSDTPEQINADHIWDKVIEHRMDSQSAFLPVREDGTYVLLSGKGRFCPARIREPASYTVRSVLPPQMTVDFANIQDECAGSVGMRAHVTFTAGSPPFLVQYDIYRNEKLVDTREHHFDGSDSKLGASRHTINYTPPDEARYRYVMKRLDDINYKGIPVNFTWTHEVKPLASASIVSGAHKQLRSCSGDNFDLEVEIQGQGPWTLEYQIISKGRLENHKIHDITETHARYSLPVPKSVQSSSGYFTVGPVAITDVHGCKRVLDSAPMRVEMKRDKATANFATLDDDQVIRILEGHSTTLPVRLTGDGPWKVGYRVNDTVTESSIQTANGNIVVDGIGIYELVSVQDQYCPGVIGTHAKISVMSYPKPSLNLHITGTPQDLLVAKNHSYLRGNICQGTPDYQDLDLRGSPPFDIRYEIEKEGSAKTVAKSMNAALGHARIDLQTDEAGHFRYRFMSIADDLYPPLKLPAPLLLEQTVMELPSVKVKSPSAIRSVCSGSTFKSIKDEDMSIVLSGAPPFSIDIVVTEDTTSKTYKQTLNDIRSHSYVLNPEMRPSSPGTYSISVIRVIDSNGCLQGMEPGLVAQSLSSQSPQMSVKVMDSAKISAMDSSEDACVGDPLEYTLEGNQPWTVEYAFNGKAHSVKNKSPRFTRVADAPGKFEIKSVSHSNSQCASSVSGGTREPGLVKTIHASPSASLRSAKNEVENIREGEQASVTFDLRGEAPFTITWQRTDFKGRVAEEHTAVDIRDNHYTILTNQEGQFQVTYIKDRYCSFPRRSKQ